MLTKISGIILILLIPVLSMAQSITGYSGVFNDGDSIVISGNSFGANGPNIDVFDDFELGSNGNTIMTGSGSAQVGQWDSLDGTGCQTYSNSNPHGGNLAFQADQSCHWVNDITARFPGVQEIFVSWWLYLPAGDNYPGEGGSGINWKQMWITGSSTSDDDLVVPTRHSAWQINGNDPDPGFSEYASGVNFVKGQWLHFAVWLNGGSNDDGNCHLWRLSEASGNLDLISNFNNVNTLKQGGAWERVGVNLYGRQTSNCHPTFDDIYIATGPNARARVEIGNAEEYYDCTKIAICTPTQWTDSSITTTARVGSFNTNEDAFLFVANSDGSISSPGFPIVIGEAGEAVEVPGVPGRPEIR